jgi:outer membrane biosynthesis protein TonB
MRQRAPFRSSLAALLLLAAIFSDPPTSAQTLNRLVKPIKTFPPVVLPDSCGSPSLPEGEQDSKAERKYSAQFDVGVDGAVLGITIYRTTGNASTDSASLAAIRACRFAPGTEEGKPVRATALVEVRWKGDGAPSIVFIDIYAKWRGQ